MFSLAHHLFEQRQHVPLMLACAFVMCPLESQAEGLWGGSLAVTSDYRVRGRSQTFGEAAVQGGLHAQFIPGWIVGAWASSVRRDNGDDSAIELDVYAGYAWSLAPDWDAKILVTHYGHPDDSSGTSYEYDEISASLAFRSRLIATVAWSPDTRASGRYEDRYQSRLQSERGASAAYELTGLQPITSSFALTAGVGYSDLRDILGTGYWYWNAGLSYIMGPVQIDVTRIDSDATAERLFGAATTQADWSAAISWRF